MSTAATEVVDFYEQCGCTYNIVQFWKRISQREHIKGRENSIVWNGMNASLYTNANILNRKMWNITVNQLYYILLLYKCGTHFGKTI